MIAPALAATIVTITTQFGLLAAVRLTGDRGITLSADWDLAGCIAGAGLLGSALVYRGVMNRWSGRSALAATVVVWALTAGLACSLVCLAIDDHIDPSHSVGKTLFVASGVTAAALGGALAGWMLFGLPQDSSGRSAAIQERVDVLAEKLEYVPLAVARSVRRRGLADTFRHGVRTVSHWLRSGRQVGSIDPSVQEFDDKYGVVTSGVTMLDELAIHSPRRGDEVDYQPSPPPIVRELLSSLPVNLADFTLVDLGCGKGLVTLVASEFPFKKIIGVDFSPELCAIARRNIDAFESPRQQCRRVQILCRDVTEFALPETPTVFYLFQPFGRETLKRLLENLRQSLEAAPREILIVYYVATYRRLFDRCGLFRRIGSGIDYVLYRTES